MCHVFVLGGSCGHTCEARDAGKEVRDLECQARRLQDLKAGNIFQHICYPPGHLIGIPAGTSCSCSRLQTLQSNRVLRAHPDQGTALTFRESNGCSLGINGSHDPSQAAAEAVSQRSGLPILACWHAIQHLWPCSMRHQGWIFTTDALPRFPPALIGLSAVLTCHTQDHRPPLELPLGLY